MTHVWVGNIYCRFDTSTTVIFKMTGLNQATEKGGDTNESQL